MQTITVYGFINKSFHSQGLLQIPVLIPSKHVLKLISNFTQLIPHRLSFSNIINNS